jgi:hypothetical protein
LPVPPDPDALNYLCRVIADSAAANNGVWEWIAGATEWTYFSDNQDWVDETELQTALSAKQDTLVSGTNIRTINNESLLGDGNIDVGGTPPDDVTIEINADNKLAVKDGAVTADKLAYTLDLSSASYTLLVKTAPVPSA